MRPSEAEATQGGADIAEEFVRMEQGITEAIQVSEELEAHRLIEPLRQEQRIRLEEAHTRLRRPMTDNELRNRRQDILQGAFRRVVGRNPTANDSITRYF